MNYKELKQSRWFHKEMHEHYEQLFNVAAKELRFSRLQIDHYKSILDEVQELVKKWCDKKLIDKVIELWKTRAVLDMSIHYDLESWG